MQLYNWQQLEEEQLNPMISRKVVHAGRITVCRMRLKKGALVQTHSHENEQITMMESGVLRFVFPDGEKTLRAGDMLTIPPHIPHKVEALEDSEATDLFSPIREDWIRGDDAYLRG
jgi:quercetin dioxygenase-like cupin family protein